MIRSAIRLLGGGLPFQASRAEGMSRRSGRLSSLSEVVSGVPQRFEPHGRVEQIVSPVR